MFAAIESRIRGGSTDSGGDQTIFLDAWNRAKPYLLALLPIAGMTALMLPFQGRLNTLNVTLLYLIVVTAISLRFGTWPSILSSIAAFLIFDFFFIPPIYTLTIARVDHVLALFVFLGVAILTTQLTIRIRIRTTEALRRGRQTATLYEISSALISEIGLDDMLLAVVERMRQVFGVDTCAILLETDGEIQLRATFGDPLDCSNQNLVDLARWVMDQRQPVSGGTGTDQAARSTGTHYPVELRPWQYRPAAARPSHRDDSPVARCACSSPAPRQFPVRRRRRTSTRNLRQSGGDRDRTQPAGAGVDTSGDSRPLR